MPTKALAIYYNSSSARSCSYAEDYRRQLSQLEGSGRVHMIASQPERESDIRQLQQWYANAIGHEALECIVIGGDGSVNIAAQVAANQKIEISVVPSGTATTLLVRWELLTGVGGCTARVNGSSDRWVKLTDIILLIMQVAGSVWRCNTYRGASANAG